MQDLLCLKIPNFQPQYKRWKKYGYTDKVEKNNLLKLLESTTGGYCMYCFSRIKVDGKSQGQLEHAIEKKNSDKLVECIPNIGLACSKCNFSFKRKGENKRKITKDVIELFESQSRCEKEKRKQCTKACVALRCLQNAYINLPEAEILLQPMSIKGTSGKLLQLQYNVLNMQFEPLENEITETEREFLKMHIYRFHLNDPQYRTTQLISFVELVIDTEGKIPQYEYNNIVIQLFAEQLECKSREERLKICKSIYPILVLNG